MGCNCKTNKIDVDINDSSEGLGQRIIKNIVKLTVFLLSLVLVPFIMIMIIWYMFQMLVLNQNLDLGKILNGIVRKTKRFNEDYEDDDDDDYEDDDELTEDDVILLDSEDITPKN